MNRKKAFWGLMVLWFVLIISYLCVKEYSFRVGDIVLLKIENFTDAKIESNSGYVSINYEISKVSANQKAYDLEGVESHLYLHNGQTVYVMLVKNGQYYIAGDIYAKLPESGLFIKGTVEAKTNFIGFGKPTVSIVYEIANSSVLKDTLPEDASDLYAQVEINSYGIAILKDFYIDPIEDTEVASVDTTTNEVETNNEK